MDSGSSRKENLQKIRNYVEQAARMGAELIVLPETADYIGEDFEGQAWEPGQAESFFGALAQQMQVYLHCGSITEQAAQGLPYNTTLFAMPDGKCGCVYRKLHLFDVDAKEKAVYQESAQIRPGNAIRVLETPVGMLGFGICYDIRFPELFRVLALNGAQILTVCANFTAATGREHWEPLLRARAIENGCYVFAANQTGTKPRFEAYGHSMLIDPWGTVLACCGRGEDIAVAEVDLEAVSRVRAQIPSLANRRSDLYELCAAVEVLRNSSDRSLHSAAKTVRT